MKLTQHTDYAIRVLMFATGRWRTEGPEALSQIREIAEAFAVSENHLMKVVHRLGAEGFLFTVRGRNGGLRLARDPEQIRIGDVVRAIESDMALVECFSDGSTCPLTNGCLLTGALMRARDAFIATLDGYTLASLVPESRAKRILSLVRVQA